LHVLGTVVKGPGRLLARAALASRLHDGRCMGRYFLSGQTTCALLLGAGLLLRAEAALRVDDATTQGAAKPAEIFPHQTVRTRQAPRAVQGTVNREPKVTRSGKARTQARKPLAHRIRPQQDRRCGASLAQPRSRCG
jgi:hypothetical protein